MEAILGIQIWKNKPLKKNAKTENQKSKNRRLISIFIWRTRKIQFKKYLKNTNAS